MSLLDRGNANVVIYPEIEGTDTDGNPFVRASTQGVPKLVQIQPMPQSGTSARRAEQDNEGFETEQIYRMRFRRGEEMNLGIRSVIDWDGETWHVSGFPVKYRGSHRTTHTDYTIKRT